jgi:hypothetical protein
VNDASSQDVLMSIYGQVGPSPDITDTAFDLSSRTPTAATSALSAARHLERCARGRRPG